MPTHKTTAPGLPSHSPLQMARPLPQNPAHPPDRILRDEQQVEQSSCALRNSNFFGTFLRSTKSRTVQFPFCQNRPPLGSILHHSRRSLCVMHPLESQSFHQKPKHADWTGQAIQRSDSTRNASVEIGLCRCSTSPHFELILENRFLPMFDLISLRNTPER